MPFAYYQRLTRVQQRVYRQSDEVTVIRLPQSGALAPLVDGMAQDLAREDRAGTQTAADRLLLGITADLRVA
ncbi:MAG: hypothetical protein HYV46_20585, partial [candidate division NC10 bacterium]|nr:hypothetical protein [candidate division NC10 bacterium]